MIISQTSGVPIYQQIADSFRSDIPEGRMKAGEYLPSIRGLAKDLRISVITTMKAYEQLESEGLVTPVQGMRKVEDALTEAIASAKIAGLSDTELMETLKILLSIREN